MFLQQGLQPTSLQRNKTAQPGQGDQLCPCSILTNTNQQTTSRLSRKLLSVRPLADGSHPLQREGASLQPPAGNPALQDRLAKSSFKDHMQRKES